MIPFINIPPVPVGPLTLQPFGLLVAAAVLVALTLARRGSPEMGLERGVVDRVATWVLFGGLVGAHLLAVLLYFPEQVATDPLVLLRFWEHLSSFGGMIGGLLAFALFMRFPARDVSRPTKFRYLHLIAFIFPFSLAIGRVGCAVVHDHPGTLTSSALAVSLESDAAQQFAARTFSTSDLAAHAGSTLAFHDLGLYELLFLVVVLVPSFIYLRRRFGLDFPFEVAFVVLYMPARFALDFLRVADATYAGLTPAQWLALAALAAAPIYWSQTKTVWRTGRSAG